jgi:nucleoside-diphosphate-sugar epimerase
MKTVLVTGGSGFIAMHVIEQLWRKGYAVKTTVRNKERAQELQAFAKAHHKTLTVVQADLCQEKGWDEATKEVVAVLHVASPFPNTPVKDEQVLVKPAVEGTKRVLRHCDKNRVKKVVVVSSIAAVAFGRTDKKRFNSEDWSNLTGGVDAYQKSKTLAEQAAWQYQKDHPKASFTLTTINPGLVIGPILGSRIGTSNEIIQKMIQGSYPGCPNIQVALVDVRDVAVGVVAAMESEKAAGQRFILADKPLWIVELAHDLKEMGYDKVATRTIPNWLVRLLGVFDKKLRLICQYLDMEKSFDCGPAKQHLKWRPTDVKKTIRSAAKDVEKRLDV